MGVSVSIACSAAGAIALIFVLQIIFHACPVHFIAFAVYVICCIYCSIFYNNNNNNNNNKQPYILSSRHWNRYSSSVGLMDPYQRLNSLSIVYCMLRRSLCDYENVSWDQAGEVFCVPVGSTKVWPIPAFKIFGLCDIWSEMLNLSFKTLPSIHVEEQLTLSSPVVPNGYTTKCSKPYWFNPPFLFFWRSGTLALRTERQSARTSKKIKMVG